MTREEQFYIKIRDLASKYAEKLKDKVQCRVVEMEDDDSSHFLIYRVLGITTKEGLLIDQYQNKGRFLYKYAGSFLEEATKLCFLEKYPKAESIRIPNTKGTRPKTFEIDLLCDGLAHEIKWRDATTDGDHITKEHTRIHVIKEAGYKPIRIMYYYPNRIQAKRIQETLEAVYAGVGGEYYCGDNAWSYVKSKTSIDLLSILTRIANELDDMNDFTV